MVCYGYALSGAVTLKEVRVFVAPVLVDVVDTHAYTYGLIEYAGGNLSRQTQRQRGVLLVSHRRGEQVVDIYVLERLGAEQTSYIVCCAEGQRAAGIEYGVPLHAELSLDTRYVVCVDTCCCRVLAAAGDDVGRYGLVVAGYVAPVVLHGCAYREVLEGRPSDTGLGFRDVAVAVVLVLCASEVSGHTRRKLVAVHVVTDVAVRREAEAESETLSQWHLECDLVEVNRVVRRAGGSLRSVVLGL